MRYLLIVANGLSVRGGIGNCLYRMLQVLRDFCPEYEIDLLLNESQSAIILGDDFPNVNVLPMQRDKILENSSRNILVNGIKDHNLFSSLKILIRRTLYKFSFALPLINLTAQYVLPTDRAYDVAISYSSIPTYISTYVARYVNAKRKILWVHSDVGQKEIRKIHGFTSLRVRKLSGYISELNQYERVIAVSEGVRESIRREFPTLNIPVEVIYNFTDVSAVRHLAEQKDVNFQFDGIKLLTVGRLSNEKGIELAVEAISMLKQAGIRFRWYFLGEDHCTRRAKRQIRKNALQSEFVHLGSMDNPYPYFKACDIYVHTSYVEGYCTAIEEARMLGKPIVTTDVAGSKEQVRDGWNGFIVPKSSKSIFAALMKLIENEDLRHKMEKNSQLLCWDISRSINAVVELLHSDSDNGEAI